MKINKILEQKEKVVFIRTNSNENTENNFYLKKEFLNYLNNFQKSEKLPKDEMLKKIYNCFKLKKYEKDDKYNDFFDSKIKLGDLIKELLKNKTSKKITYDFLIKHWNSMDGKNKSSGYKDVLIEINKKYGHNFCKLIGNFVVNYNKKLDEIIKEKKSLPNKIYKSLMNNKVKTNLICIGENKIDDKFIKMFESNLKNSKVSLFNNINSKKEKLSEHNITNYLKFYYIWIKKAILNKKDSNLSFDKDVIFKGKKTRQLEKLYRVLKNDINFIIFGNKQFNRLKKKQILEKYKNFNLEKNINKLIEKMVNKAKTLKTLTIPEFEHHTNLILEKNTDIDNYDVMLSHSIYKLYRNLASISGCSIINYNLYNNIEENKFYDFSLPKKEFKQKLENSKNYENWELGKFNNLDIQNFKKSMFIALQNFRNTSIHIRDIKNLNEDLNFSKEDKNKLISELEKLFESSIKEEFKTHKIKKIDYEFQHYYDKTISISYNKIFDNLFLNSKNISNKKNMFKKFFENKFQKIELFNSQNYLLKWIYENNFQLYLKNLEINDWKKMIQKFKNNYESEPKIIALLENNLNNFDLNNNEIISEKVAMFLNSQLSDSNIKKIKGSNKSVFEKNQKIITNLWTDLFESFLINNKFCEFLKKDEIVENGEDIEFKIELNIKYSPIILVLLSLKNEEISKFEKYLNNFYNRVFKENIFVNKKVNLKVDYQSLLEKDNILNLINICKFMKDIHDIKLNKINSNKEVKQFWKKIYGEKKEFPENENVFINSSNKNFSELYYLSKNKMINNNVFEELVNNVKFEKTETNIVKEQELLNSQIKRYENKQSLIDAILLNKELHYLLINWVMHREFDLFNKKTRKFNNYFVVNEDELIFNMLKKLFEIKKSDKSKKNWQQNCEKIKKWLESEQNVDSDYIEDIKILKTNIEKFIETDYNEFIELDENSKKNKVITCFSHIKDENNNPLINDISDFKNSKDKIRNNWFLKGKQKENHNNVIKILNYFSHLNYSGNKKEEINNNNMIDIINTLRSSMDDNRHKKNTITSSIIRLFDKKGLEIIFEFEEHKITKIDLNSKVVMLNDADKEFPYYLKNENEIKLHKKVLKID